MSDKSVQMWDYWREQYGPVYTLEHYYADLLERDKDLQQAISQIKNAERAIDAIMEELANE